MKCEVRIGVSIKYKIYVFFRRIYQFSVGILAFFNFGRKVKVYGIKFFIIENDFELYYKEIQRQDLYKILSLEMD